MFPKTRGTPARFALRTVLALSIAAAHAAGATPQGAGACTADWLPTFGGDGVPSPYVRALIEFDDGSGPALYVGGDFPAIGGLSVDFIARWNGTQWTTLGSGLGGPCYSLAVFDDGTGAALYAGGDFATAGGQPASGVARWNGTTWQALGTGLAGNFTNWPTIGSDLHVFDDGSGGGPALYVTGSFTSAGTASAVGIARWDGATWSGLGAGLDAFTWAMATFDDGSGPALFVGGAFQNAGGAPAARIARWSGGSWSTVGSGMGGPVYALAVYPASAGGAPALFAGGTFTSAGGVPCSSLATWDGIQWAASTSVTVGFPPEPGWVSALSVIDDGTGPALFAGGFFTHAGAIASHIVRFDSAGWSALGSGVNDEVLAIAGFDGGSGVDIYASGGFSAAGDVITGPIARWDGAAWSALTLGHSNVRGIVVHDDGSGAGPSLFAFGGIHTGSGTYSPIARWNGASWASLVNGPTGPGAIQTIAVFDDGQGGGPTLYAAGGFTQIGGVPANRIARWNGTNWSAIGSGANDYVYALEVVTTSTGYQELYAGGSFTNMNGVSASQIARFDGATWSALGTGCNQTVRDIAAYHDGGNLGVFATGDFQSAGGGLRNYVAKWNGSSWESLGNGLGSPGQTLAVFDDGTGPELYVGGSFMMAGNAPASRIARWNGSIWRTVGSGLDDHVQTMAVFDDSAGAALFAGGVFTTAGGAPAQHVARWRAGAWSAVGAGVDGDVHDLAAMDIGSGTALYVAGDFGVSPAGDARIARYGCDGRGTGTNVCAGDGTGAACPCGNFGAPGNGCASSVNPAGARLSGSGTASIANDMLVLHGSGMPDAAALYYQGTTTTGVPFGDGLRCAGGTNRRIGTKTNVAGSSRYPEAGDASIRERGTLSVSATRTYQIWYRNAAAFCTPSTFNLSNGLRILWTP